MLVGENMFKLWAVGTYVLHIATPPPCDSCQVAQVQKIVHVRKLAKINENQLQVVVENQQRIVIENEVENRSH